MTKRNKVFYRLVVSSNKVITGNANSGTYSIDCTQMLSADPKKQYQIAVEYFITSTAITQALININSLTQVNSWNTLTGSASQNVLMLTSSSFSRTIHHNSIGHLITNIDFMRSSQMNIVFTDMTGATLTGMGGWVLGLVIWEVEQE
jgi:hypothetical protein